MQYEAKSWRQNGTPKDNGNGTSSFPIIVTVGIVGDTYGFLAPNPEKNMTTVIISNRAKDIEQQKVLCDTAAALLVTTNYPNT